MINQQRTIRFFWVNILYFLTYIVFTLGGLYIFPYQIDGPIWGRLLSSVLLFMICLYFFAREYGISLHKEYVTETFFFCLPLVYYSIIMWVTNYGDRYIINFMLKKFDVGIYDFALKVTLLIDVVLMALTNTINPVIYRIWSEKKIKHSTDEINQNHHFFTLTQLFLIALTLLVMPLAVPLFVKNTDYFTSFQYLPILVLGFLFRSRSNMYMMPLLYYKKTKVLPKVFLISSVIQIAAGFVFIKYWGIWGVVISFVITKPIQVWLLARESSKVYEFKFNKAKMIYLPMVYGISLICFYSIGTKFVDRIYMDILQFVFCCTLIGIVFWNEINEKILSRFLAKK